MAKVDSSRNDSRDDSTRTADTTADLDNPKNQGQPRKVAENNIQESGVSKSEIEQLLGRVYGSNVELVEETEGDKHVAKARVTTYGTGTFVIDGRGDSADEARTDLWNRVPKYRNRPSPSVLSEPHDYTRPNSV